VLDLGIAGVFRGDRCGNMGLVVPGRRGVAAESAPPFRHRLIRQAQVSTVLLGGELDLTSAQAVQALLFEQVQAPAVTEIRVDLAEVGFLDSSALGVLIKSLNYAQDEGRDLVVVNASLAARRILAVTGLQEILMRP
jgi:anti-sigma B factor antagonist